MEPLTKDDPSEIAGYRLRGRLGAGGMGVVYLGCTPAGRAVAVKIMRPDLAADPDFRIRFRQEIEAARRVRGLYTAEVIDADPAGAPPWLVTAYVPGPSLQQAVTRHGPMPVATVYRLMAGVAEALQAIHAAGVVHRDLKPSNVLLAPDGPRVIDFGIARAAEATALTRSGFRVGSPQFMAPEQVEGQPATPATDIFALGALAAYAVLGRAPFGDGGAEAVLYRILHQNPDLAACPMPLRTLIERCLGKDVAHRPPAAEIIWFCQAQLAQGQGPGRVTGIAQSWLPPGIAADLAYRSTLASAPPGQAAPAGGPAPIPTAVATPAAGPPRPAPQAWMPAAGPPRPPPQSWMPGISPPPSVAAAVRLMYAGAASAVLNMIAGSAAEYSLVHRTLENLPNVTQKAVALGTAFDVTVEIFIGLAGTGLWLWMAHANRNGRGWARIMSTVLFAILTLTLPWSFILLSRAVDVAVIAAWCTGLIQWAVALAALVPLWAESSSAYFAAMRRPAGPYPPLRQPGPW
jgi:hypothetical protein